MLLHLIRHGKPRIDPLLPPGRWALDPAGLEAIGTFREALPISARRATWYCSGERKAIETAQHLTAAEVTAVPELREAERGDYIEDRFAFNNAVTRGLQNETTAALPGWEPLLKTRQRVRQALDLITAREDGDVVLVGHGTAWTLLLADILGESTPSAVPQMAMPDLLIVDMDHQTVLSGWGEWHAPA